VKRWLLVGLATTAAIAAVVAFVIPSSNSTGKGPLVEPPGSGHQSFSQPVNVGQSASVSGPFVVDNTSDKQLVLEDVQLIGRQGGIALRGAFIVAYPDNPNGPRPRSAMIGVIPGYKLSRGDHAVPGAIVPAHGQVAVVLGVTATKPGRHAWLATEITYHVGNHTYQGRYPISGRLCAPLKPYLSGARCRTPMDTGEVR